MKKVFILFVFMFMILMSEVHAETDVYFINVNGVQMTEVEYNNIKKIHGEEFLNNIDLETFHLYHDFYNFENLEIKKSCSDDFNNLIIPYSSTISTEYKTLSITSAKYGSNSMINITIKWKKLPIIRSYDVFGFRMTSGNYSNLMTKTFFNGLLVDSHKNVKKESNAYGFSVQLPTDCKNISMNISFTTTSGGMIYASYQHAVEYITSNDSMNFMFSKNGLGEVFLFKNNMLFDKMQGVNINI